MLFASRWLALVILVVAAPLGACGGASPTFTGTGGDGAGGAATTVDAPGSGGTDGDGGDDTVGGDDLVGDDSVAGGADGGRCQAVVQQHPDEGATHIVQCTPTTYLTNPPSSGNHYPIWANYGVYDKPVPWGFLVHQLEHGAVVISYRCAAGPSGCNVDLSGVQAFIASLPPDDVCLARKLITVVPDPALDVAFAASAWTWTLRADCFDAAVFGDFVSQHYGHGLERVCGGGIDLSASGWCP
ncbi:MAG TPA: DUF3105 domain-containing protein [Polyangia bacterium]|nr:DUF3105 domain-containing protein [Polyangia bacterium]